MTNIEIKFEVSQEDAAKMLSEHLKSLCKDGSNKHVIHNDADRHENHSFIGTLYLQHDHWKEFDPNDDEDRHGYGNNQPVRVHMSSCGGYGLEIGFNVYKDGLECEGCHDKEEAYYDYDFKRWCRVTPGFEELLDKIMNAGTKFSEWTDDMPMYM